MPFPDESQASQRFSDELEATDNGHRSDTHSHQPTLSMCTVDGEPQPRVAGEAASRSLVRYRPLRTHARGGLGEVFVAQDDELHREVALKRIQAPFADDLEVRQRFLREAQITGALEHPGIAPVYGMGTDADGRPYYAMRLIRGESLRDAIKRFHAQAAKPGQNVARYYREAFTGLEFRKLLQRFIELCNILEYAHSRGILHRDIKPSNVMLGRYGETLVVDWGLARPVDQPESAAESSLGPLTTSDGELSLTRDGSVVGTPAYMSPEQASGRTQAISTRSDIYSLGATLYTMFTGRPPFEGEKVEPLLVQVANGEFPPPRRLRPELSRRLEAICLKAMARRPSDRYASCAALAEDVEYWLADEPVSVLPDTFLAQLFRWMRRRRTAVAAGAAAVLVAALAMAAATGLLAKANRDLGEMNFREAAATRRAIEAATEIKRQEERTRESYRLAKAALDEVMELQQDPRFQQGVLEDVQRKLQEVEAEFYERFVAIQGDNPAFQLERARAFQRLAYLEQTQGSWEEAIRRHETAISILTPLAEQQSEAPEPQSLLAYCQAALASAYSNTGRTSLALATYEKAEQTLEKLIAEFPGRVEFANHLALVLKNHGVAYYNTGQPGDTERLYLRSLKIRIPLVAANPANHWLRNDLASSQHYLANFYRPTRPEESHRYYEEALANFEAVVRDAPFKAEFQSNLASCLMNFALLHASVKRSPEAEAAVLKAIALQKQLNEEHPFQKNYRHDLGRSYRVLGSIYEAQAARAPEAVAAYEEAAAVLQPLADTHRSVAIYLNDLIETWAGLARVYDRLQDLDRSAAAQTRVAELVERSEQLAAASAAESISDDALAALDAAITVRPDSSALHFRRGSLLASREQWKLASASFQRAVELSPEQHWYWYMSGTLLLLSGDREEYQRFCQRLMEKYGATEDPVIAERTAKICLLAPDPPVDISRLATMADLAVTRGADHQYLPYFRLVRAMAAYRQGDYEDAIGWVEKSGFTAPRRDVSFALGSLLLGMAYHRLGRLEESQPLLEKTFAWLDGQPSAQNGANVDWLMCQIIRREAESLIRKSP